ncbi:hypothetical protein OIU84_004227 [Salix udensis]|uniref:Uncharacterized protein n=1 Tax=Salix udensis TaxID=889485 RepID=A0AAD6K1Q8_9ROSI|nr:hypothetical protein OIU84_004227 [Salix udensis]
MSFIESLPLFHQIFLEEKRVEIQNMCLSDTAADTDDDSVSQALETQSWAIFACNCCSVGKLKSPLTLPLSYVTQSDQGSVSALQINRQSLRPARSCFWAGGWLGNLNYSVSWDSRYFVLQSSGCLWSKNIKSQDRPIIVDWNRMRFN